MQHDFSQGNIPRLIGKMAAPMIMAEMVNALYSIVDRMYIGRIPGVGTMALAGVGVAYPIILIVTAFATLFGMGGTPLCAIARGEKNQERAERIMGSAFAMLILVGVVLTVLVQMFRHRLLLLFGASADTLVFAERYLTVYLMGTLFVMATMGMNPYINAQGFTKIGMLSVAIGAVSNALLDPLFIFTFGMGVQGAALATILSQAISACWILRFLTSDKAILKLRRKYIGFDWPLIRRIVALGTSTFTMRLTECAVAIACNVTLRNYGGDVYVTVMTVIGSIRSMLMMPLNGFVQGFQPVIGYNYGAKRNDRVRACIRFATLACFCYAGLSSVMVMAAPQLMIRMFNGSDEMLKVGVPAVRIYFSGFSMLFMQMAGQHSFVALGKSRQAVFFSLLRKAFIVLPLTFLLPRFVGVTGVFWAEVISDVVGSSACYLTFMLTVYRKELR